MTHSPNDNQSGAVSSISDESKEEWATKILSYLIDISLPGCMDFYINEAWDEFIMGQEAEKWCREVAIEIVSKIRADEYVLVELIEELIVNFIRFRTYI